MSGTFRALPSLLAMMTMMIKVMILAPSHEAVERKKGRKKKSRFLDAFMASKVQNDFVSFLKTPSLISSPRSCLHHNGIVEKQDKDCLTFW